MRAGKVASARKRSPVTVHMRPSSWRARHSYFPGSRVRLLVHDRIDGADLYGGINEISGGTTVPLHWHRRGEIQYILSGRGVLLGPDGRETPVGPRSAVFSPAGRAGMHGFRAVGRWPLAVLFFYASPGGKPMWLGLPRS